MVCNGFKCGSKNAKNVLTLSLYNKPIVPNTNSITSACSNHLHMKSSQIWLFSSPPAPTQVPFLAWSCISHSQTIHHNDWQVVSFKMVPSLQLSTNPLFSNWLPKKMGWSNIVIDPMSGAQHTSSPTPNPRVIGISLKATISACIWPPYIPQTSCPCPILNPFLIAPKFRGVLHF